MRERSFSTLELCIVVFLIGCFIVMGIGIYCHFLKRAKEVVLQTELKNMRAVIAFYYGIYHRYPEDLREIKERGYIDFSGKPPLFKKRQLELLIVDKEGYPVDPFGNRYLYDKERGCVTSQTRGYERW